MSARMANSTSPSERKGIPSAWLVLAVASLLGAHVALAFLGVIGRSVTADETAHLTAGYSYWIFNDYRLQPENGNLPQRWGAIPLLLLRPGLDPNINNDDWKASRVWNIAQTFLFESGNNSDYALLCARTWMLFWSICAGLLVFAWARSVWGDWAGLASLALFSFSPTTLAHGPLVTSDMCAAACLLSACAACWRMCMRPTLPRVALFGFAAGIAFVAKFSAVLLIPVYAALAIIAWKTGRRTSPSASAPGFVLNLGPAFGIAAVITVFVIWAFFGFRYAAANIEVSPFDHFYLTWDRLFENKLLRDQLVNFARELLLLPEAFLYGFTFVAYFSGARGAFLAGEFSSTGWWWFFPFAVLVKSTIGELLLTALLLIRGLPLLTKARLLTWQRISASPLLPLSLFALVYSIFSITSELNIGQRHILPLYLILFIVSGSLVSVISPVRIRVFGTMGILFSAGECLSNHPNHLAFFNRLAGGAENGWRLLVDSSLDWGQDVSALGLWVQKNRLPHEPVFVSSFGTADPAYEGIEGEMLSPYYSLSRPRHWFELEPGLYCISATMLQDVYGIRPGPWMIKLEKDFQYLKVAAKENIASGTWSTRLPDTGHHPEQPLWLLDRLRFARLCHYLKSRKPDAIINHSQFVFRLSSAELDVFLNRPYSALAAQIEANVEGTKP